MLPRISSGELTYKLTVGGDHEPLTVSGYALLVKTSGYLLAYLYDMILQRVIQPRTEPNYSILCIGTENNKFCSPLDRA